MIETAETACPTRPFESWVGPHRIYVEGREPVDPPVSKPPILFIGGAFDGSWIFRREMEYLAARGWRVYALNLRGYYKSQWNDIASLSVEDYLEDIRTVREALKLDPVIMSGYSMGGLLALKHAEQHGAAALMLYDSDPSREIWQAIGRGPHRQNVSPVLRFWPSYAIVREMWGGWVSRRRYQEFLDLFKQSAVSGRAYRLTEYGGVSVNTWKIRSPALVIGIRRDERVQAEWFRRLNAGWLVFEGNSHGSILVGPKSLAITEEAGRWLEFCFGGGHEMLRRKKIFPVLGFVTHDLQNFRMRLLYYSGWRYPEVEVRAPGRRRPAIRIKMERVGQGRVEQESLYEATLVLNRQGGFFLREGKDEDRPQGGGFYKPFAQEIYLADGEYYSERPPIKPAPPAYHDLKLYSNDLHYHFRIHLMLPRNFRRDGRPYPVCILNDGQNQWKNQGACGGWHTNVITAGLAKRGRCKDVALVSVESSQLHRNKYFLTPPAGRGDLYVNFLADVLLPHLRRDFNLTVRPDEIGIVGSSFGANNAVYAGLKRPDVFGLIGSLSYAPLKGRPLRKWMQDTPRLPFRKLYLDCGTRWTADQRGHRTDNTKTTLDFIHLAQSKGMIQGRTMLGWVAKGHCHNEFYWRKRVGRCMEFLFSLI